MVDLSHQFFGCWPGHTRPGIPWDASRIHLLARGPGRTRAPDPCRRAIGQVYVQEDHEDVAREPVDRPGSGALFFWENCLRCHRWQWKMAYLYIYTYIYIYIHMYNIIIYIYVYYSIDSPIEKNLKTRGSIYRGFSVAMFEYQRVDVVTIVRRHWI